MTALAGALVVAGVMPGGLRQLRPPASRRPASRRPVHDGRLPGHGHQLRDFSHLYQSAPAGRLPTTSTNTTEDMLALGLESRMVGTFGVTGDGPVGQPVPAPYLAGFHQVRDVSPDYFTKEELVACTGLRPAAVGHLSYAWRFGESRRSSHQR